MCLLSVLGPQRDWCVQPSAPNQKQFKSRKILRIKHRPTILTLRAPASEHPFRAFCANDNNDNLFHHASTNGKCHSLYLLRTCAVPRSDSEVNKTKNRKNCWKNWRNAHTMCAKSPDNIQRVRLLCVIGVSEIFSSVFVCTNRPFWCNLIFIFFSGFLACQSHGKSCKSYAQASCNTGNIRRQGKKPTAASNAAARQSFYDAVDLN